MVMVHHMNTENKVMTPLKLGILLVLGLVNFQVEFKLKIPDFKNRFIFYTKNGVPASYSVLPAIGEFVLKPIIVEDVYFFSIYILGIGFN